MQIAFVLSTQFFIASAALPALVKSVTYFLYAPLLSFACRLAAAQSIAYSTRTNPVLKIISQPPKHLRRWQG
ncbi:hypothetical protein KCP77_00065 [Salmonella enterica subsp. enterica]|nr:hypothetical protein KCP77_00065 [Salmonella enterica subsp. enterica]